MKIIKKNKVAILLFSGIVLSMSSCTVSQIGGKGAIPVLLNQPNEKVQLIQHVVVKKRRVFNYSNYYETSELLSNKVRDIKPDMIINTTAKIRVGALDMLLDLVTIGFADSKRVIIDADFVRLTEKK